jgi:hypothetical protein
MSKINGKSPNRIKVTELLLDSGVRVYVRPLSQYTRQVVFQRLREKFPYPKESDYEEQIEGSDSPGAVIPVTSEANQRHEEWQALVDKADNQRNRGYFEVIVEMCVTWVDTTQDALIKQNGSIHCITLYAPHRPI